MLSIILNLSIVIAAIGAVYAHGRNNPISNVLRYFTVLSNLLCAAAAAAVAGLKENLSGVGSAAKTAFSFAILINSLTIKSLFFL